MTKPFFTAEDFDLIIDGQQNGMWPCIPNGKDIADIANAKAQPLVKANEVMKSALEYYGGTSVGGKARTSLKEVESLLGEREDEKK